MSYLKRVAGHRTVPVERGSNYLATDFDEQARAAGSAEALMQRVVKRMAVLERLAQDARHEPLGGVLAHRGRV